jgi:hypothetical protein
LRIVAYVVFVLLFYVQKHGFAICQFSPLKYLSGSSIVIVARVKSCKVGGH